MLNKLIKAIFLSKNIKYDIDNFYIKGNKGIYSISYRVSILDMKILINDEIIFFSLEEKKYIVKALYIIDPLKTSPIIKRTYFENPLDHKKIKLNPEELPNLSSFYEEIFKTSTIGKNIITLEKKFYKDVNTFEKTLEEPFSVIEFKASKPKIKIIHKGNNKNQLVELEDTFNDLGSFGTLGDLFPKIPNKSTNDKTRINFDTYEDYEEKFFIPLYDKRPENKEKKKKDEKVIDSLVLWDMENIHYKDDFTEITRLIKKENQLMMVGYADKYVKYTKAKKINLNFILKGLRKRGWVIKTTKKIADDLLFKNFEKYKGQIKEVVIISNDSDFKNILEEANRLHMKSTVIIRLKEIRANNWFDVSDKVINLL